MQGVSRLQLVTSEFPASPQSPIEFALVSRPRTLNGLRERSNMVLSLSNTTKIHAVEAFFEVSNLPMANLWLRQMLKAD
jgi:hypothetical protein